MVVFVRRRIDLGAKQQAVRQHVIVPGLQAGKETS
jgi:hypothetical protein